MHGVMRGAIHWLFIVIVAQAGQALVPPGGLGGLDKAPPKHLTLSTSASPPNLTTPGSGVSLFLDVTPNPGIHVYAPGAKDYLPIRLTLEPLADLAIGKTIYPKSETIVFERERVPVFQKPFRLVEQVTIARTARPGTTMTIRGTVNYQACDDKVCFIPAAAPVTWTLTVR
jgi:DsbC/DsbD-like thiol-disulfide interchange protein